MLSWLGDMKAYSSRIRFSLLAVLAVASAGISSHCFAQNAAAPTVEAIPAINGKTDITVQELHPKVFTTPFPINAKSERKDRLEYRAPEQMTAADRELAETNQAEIARRASLQGFDPGSGGEGKGEGSWGYEQAVCPVFPQHLILEYSRINGNGDVTLFSAVIPRGDGHVRVIPVRRRSYSLWTPAPSNALTINDFNHMVQEGQEGLSPDWLTLGLCYAALAGGHVRAALIPQSAAEEVYPLFVPAKLTISQKSGAEILFVDVTPHSKAMNWNLDFDSKGHLLKVRHSVAAELLKKPVPGAPVDVAASGHS